MQLKILWIFFLFFPSENKLPQTKKEKYVPEGTKQENMDFFEPATQMLIIVFSLFTVLVTTRYITDLTLKKNNFDQWRHHLQKTIDNILEENPHMTELAQNVPNYESLEDIKTFIQYLKVSVDAQVFSQMDTNTITEIISNSYQFFGL